MRKIYPHKTPPLSPVFLPPYFYARTRATVLIARRSWQRAEQEEQVPKLGHKSRSRRETFRWKGAAETEPNGKPAASSPLCRPLFPGCFPRAAPLRVSRWCPCNGGRKEAKCLRRVMVWYTGSLPVRVEGTANVSLSRWTNVHKGLPLLSASLSSGRLGHSVCLCHLQSSIHKTLWEALPPKGHVKKNDFVLV